MYQGKHARKSAPKRTRRLRWRKEFLVLCSAIVLLIGVIGGTLAYLTTATTPVENTFAPGKVPCEVHEEFDGADKNNIRVQNDGNIDAFIRVALVFSWQNEAGEISGVPVKRSDYIMTLNEPDWFPQDGYYYYKHSVSPDGFTKMLTNAVVQNGTPPEGYFLCLDVLAESIQAKGTTAGGKPVVAEVWGVTYNDDGTISK